MAVATTPIRGRKRQKARRGIFKGEETGATRRSFQKAQNHGFWRSFIEPPRRKGGGLEGMADEPRKLGTRRRGKPVIPPGLSSQTPAVSWKGPCHCSLLREYANYSWRQSCSFKTRTRAESRPCPVREGAPSGDLYGSEFGNVRVYASNGTRRFCEGKFEPVRARAADWPAVECRLRWGLIRCLPGWRERGKRHRV